jgi:DDE family transposase
VTIPLLQRFAGGVCLIDNTSLTLPPAFAGIGIKLRATDVLSFLTCLCTIVHARTRSYCMNANLTTVSGHLESLFSSTADEAARQTGFVRRQSKLGGSEFARALVFGWLHNPQATLEELAQCSTALGVSISPQGLDQRFGPRAAAFFERLLQNAVLRVVSADPVTIPLLQRFAGGVCLIDNTSLTLPPAFAGAWRASGAGPEKGIAGMKVHVRLDLVDGTLTGPFLHPGYVSEHATMQQAPSLPPGALRLADMGFFSVGNLQALHQQQVCWLTRLQFNTRFRDSNGQVWTVPAFVAQLPGDRIDAPIWLGLDERLPCRLIVVRAAPEVVDKRRQRLQKYRRRRGRVHRDRWRLADWTIYVTNIPAERLSVAEALILARCRWQIELLFKLWKSEGRVHESRSHKPWKVLCEIYAKLLGMVVQHWLLLVGCWSHANRSLVKASRTVRRHVWPLALVLTRGHLVYGILMHLQRCLARGCRVNRRRRAPPTHQLLCGLSKAG